MASVSGGECKVFDRPQFAVLGQTSYDQKWIDGNTEAGIAACGWDRPAKRPEDLQPMAAAKPKPIKRKTLLQKAKAIVTREPDPAPALPPVPYIEAKPAEPSDDLLDAPEPPATAVKPKRKLWWQR